MQITMFSIHRYVERITYAPFLFPTICYTIGIWKSNLGYNLHSTYYILFTLLLVSAIGLYLLSKGYCRKKRALALLLYILLGISFVLIGKIRKINETPQFQDDHLIHIQNKLNTYHGILIGDIKRGRYYKIGYLQLTAVEVNGMWRSCRGIVQIQWSNKSEFDPESGDSLLCIGSPIVINETKKWDKYLCKRGIYHRAELKNGKIVSKNKGWQRVVNQAKRWTKKQIDLLPINANSNSFIQALILADRTALKEEIKYNFATAGILHVLAVSGFHVGLFFLILFLLLSLLGHMISLSQGGKRKIQVIIIPFLWFYASIVGATPSVVRATLLSSLFILGKYINRKGNLLNLLSAAAFLMLFWDPFLLYDVGFQLSFLSLLGIYYNSSIWFKFWNPKWRLIRSMWHMIGLSLGAQLMTIPLTTYYFGYISTYFLIGNIVIIPLLTLSLYSTIGLWIISQLPWIGLVASLHLGRAIDHSFSFLIQLAAMINKWPYSRIKYNSSNLWSILLWYAGLVFFYLLIDEILSPRSKRI